MKIKRIYNHNVVLAIRDDGKEAILVGKGLAYGSSKGDTIKEEKINKVFEMKKEISQKFASVVQNIPYEYILVSEEVIKVIRNKSKKKMNDSIYITLTEHIANLVERIEMGIVFDSALLLNVKSLYKEEYELASIGVDIIRERIGIEIDDDEISFIALHIITAEMDSNMPHMYKITSIIEDVMEVVKKHFDAEIESSACDRFLIHCRFFAQRVVNDEYLESNSGKNLQTYLMYVDTYERQNACIKEIANLIQEKYNYEMNIDEKFYILLHLVKFTEN